MNGSGFRTICLVTWAFLLVACGSGGSGSAGGTGQPPGPPPPPPPQPSFINLSSDPGDFIGAGGTYRYTNADALITVTVNGARLSISIDGDETWYGEFQLPNMHNEFQTGTFDNLTRYPFHNAAVGGLSWHGEGRGCNMLTGSIVVTKVVYDGATLAEIDLRFEQHCEGNTPALYGSIHWDSDDATRPPGPLTQLPTGLWEPASGTTPSTGNYIYLESQPGDFVGAGGSYTYSSVNSFMTLNAAEGRLSVNVNGNERWNGNFQAMNTLSQLEVGYYGDLRRYPFHNPVKGGMDWDGEGRGCNTLAGWFVVDSVTYSGPTLRAIDLRFEQHCDGGTSALNGEIHWNADDNTGPPGPVTPPPAGLWAPAPGDIPASGNYVYLESEFGEFIGAGGSYTHTQANAELSVSTSAARMTISINGDQQWTGNFQAMDTLNRIERGYYGELQRYPFHNPAKGGLSWSGEGRGCNNVAGWFVVDDVTYAGSTLMAIDLRFEQFCDGGTTALHGAIHWDSNDPTVPPGPVVPAPAGLWEPAPGVTPAAINYVYIESQQNGGALESYTHTQADSVIRMNAFDARLNVFVDGDRDWSGDFAAMNGLTQLEPGYYGDLQSFPFHNPAIGGLSWGGCSDSLGWLVIDSVSYQNGALAAIDFRFEQVCAGGSYVVRGEVHWDATDPTSPSGPVVPAPAGLWQPMPGSMPATGNFIYLESEPGDYIGQGATYTLTPTDMDIRVNATGAHLSVFVNENVRWSGDFEAMYTLDQFEVGFYDGLQRHGFHNPTRGGLSWHGNGRACNSLSGWFVVDSVTYNGAALTSIDLRFGQHCEGAAPALNGVIHWSL